MHPSARIASVLRGPHATGVSQQRCRSGNAPPSLCHRTLPLRFLGDFVAWAKMLRLVLWIILLCGASAVAWGVVAVSDDLLWRGCCGRRRTPLRAVRSALRRRIARRAEQSATAAAAHAD